MRCGSCGNVMTEGGLAHVCPLGADGESHHKRFLVRDGQLVEIGQAWEDDARRSTGDLEKVALSRGMRMMDGTMVSSMSELSAWQKRTGKEHHSEIQQEAARARANRAAEQAEARKRTVVESFKQLEATKWRRK
jgi:hypothetical protein